MSLPGIFRRLFANDGYGPLLRREIIPYEICEFYYFRHPVLRPGFQPAQGGLIENAAELYPEAWEYLQTEEGRLLCKTEAEWQAMTTATWATLADGTKVGWDGIGGAPFYVQNESAGSLRLPDLRGMYMEAAGFDSLDVGDVHGDMTRRLLGAISGICATGTSARSNGVLLWINQNYNVRTNFVTGSAPADVQIDSYRTMPTGNVNKPRAYGTLACVYLGQPAG